MSSNAAQTIGERLLSGWSMLAEVCPRENCYSPLMKNRQGETWCVVCDMLCISEDEAHRQGLILSDQPMSADGDVPAQENDLRSVFESAFQASYSRYRGGDGELVEGREEEADEEEQEWIPPTEEEMRVIEERRRQRDRISEMLGPKMLLGWTLLGQHCEREDCRVLGVPLLRDPAGNLHCVACEDQPRVLQENPPEMMERQVQRQVSPADLVVESKPDEKRTLVDISNVEKEMFLKLSAYATVLSSISPIEVERVKSVAETITALSSAILSVRNLKD